MIIPDRIHIIRWEKFVEPVAESGCWIWTGACVKAGYGRVGWRNMETGQDATYQAHRVFYELLKGPIPDGLQIDHLCCVKSCVNPDHMEVVTHKVNTLRGNSMSARHARKTHCIRGHALTPDNCYRWERYPHYRYCKQCHKLNSKGRVRTKLAKKKAVS